MALHKHGMCMYVVGLDRKELPFDIFWLFYRQVKRGRERGGGGGGGGGGRERETERERERERKGGRVYTVVSPLIQTTYMYKKYTHIIR